MTIADKLQTIAENEQKVYEAGEEKGFQNGFESGYTDGYSLGESAGRQAERDAFWDQCQYYGRRIDYLYAFAGGSWTDKTYNPKYTIKPTGNGNGMFFHSGVTDTKVTIDLSETKQNIQNMFANSKIKTIPLLIVSETTPNMGPTYSAPFQNCSELENITIEGVIAKNINLQWSALLSHDSIVSVVNALSATATGSTATFSKTAVQNAFETSEGAADGSTSEAWLSLVATKSNWTISLV